MISKFDRGGPPQTLQHRMRPPMDRGFALIAKPSHSTVDAEQKKHEVPLAHVNIDTVVTSGRAILTMEQTFINDFDISLDVEYIFPILVRSCITDFIAICGDGYYRGVIGERQEVRART